MHSETAYLWNLSFSLLNYSYQLDDVHNDVTNIKQMGKHREVIIRLA